jgi:hypothetical protein
LGWKVAPVLCGPFSVENIRVFSLIVYQSLNGQLFRNCPKGERRFSAYRGYEGITFRSLRYDCLWPNAAIIGFRLERQLSGDKLPYTAIGHDGRI